MGTRSPGAAISGQRQMTKPNVYNLIFNGLGVLLGLIVVGYIVRSAFLTETEPPCSARYPASLQFALKTPGGALLSPIELQARVGLHEWGIMGNAEIVPEGPGGAALQVKLATVNQDETGGAQRSNGVHFRWSPAGIGQAHSACLMYSVWLPKDFAFNSGGLLPGIVGGTSAAANGDAGQNGRFGTRIRWRRDGGAELAVASTGSGYLPAGRRSFPLERGKWTRFEQEIVLNTPGQADGMVRMWVDGQLKAQAEKLSLRTDAMGKIIGVLADVGYVRQGDKTGVLRISPFELAWR